MKVLIVERNDLIQIQLKKILTDKKGMVCVRQAYSYKEAVKIFPHYWPDTVLLDSALLDGSSLLLLQIFKKLKPDIKVIIMASLPTATFKKVCLDSGAADFFEKSNIDHLFLAKIAKRSDFPN